MRRFRQALCVVLAVVAAAGAAQAQEAGGAGIVARVKFTQQQFLELTDRMLEVADLLESSEPESTAVLREAVRQARRAFIAEDMEKVAAALTDGLTSAAATSQAGVVAELEKLLALLQAGAMNLQERAERLKTWREQLASIKDLLAKQQQLADQTKLTSQAAELDAQLADLSRRLADIVSRQTQLRDATRQEAGASGGGLERLGELRDRLRRLRDRQEGLLRSTGQVGIDKLPLVARVQRELAEKVRRTRQDLLNAAADPSVAEAMTQAGIEPRELTAAAGLVGRAAESMTGAAEELDVPNAEQAATHQQNAQADLDAAAKALTDMLRGASAGKPGEQLSRQQQALADETSQLAKDVATMNQRVKEASPEEIGTAGEEMAAAADDLAEGLIDRAVPHQDEALRRLAEEKARLAQLRERVAKRASRPLEDQAAEQRDLAERAERTATQMAGDAATEPTPGQPDVAEAGSEMTQAGEQLGRQQGADSAEKATDHQDQAIERLERARETLAEAIEREQQQQDTQRLAQIDKMLQEILDGQKNITAATKVVDAAGADGFDRPAQLKLGELSRGEGKLADKVRTAVQLLTDEARTAVFPTMLGEVAEQLVLLQTRLGERQPDVITQSIQEDVEAALTDMIEAVRQEMSRRRNEGAGGGSGGGGSGAPKPLIPPVAELNLLWRLQQQIARRTSELNAASAVLSDRQRRARHEQLAERQKQLYDMAVDLEQKVKQAQSPSEGRPDNPQEAQP